MVYKLTLLQISPNTPLHDKTMLGQPTRAVRGRMIRLIKHNITVFFAALERSITGKIAAIDA